MIQRPQKRGVFHAKPVKKPVDVKISKSTTSLLLIPIIKKGCLLISISIILLFCLSYLSLWTLNLKYSILNFLICGSCIMSAIIIFCLVIKKIKK